MKYTTVIFGLLFTQLVACSDFFRPQSFTTGCLLGTSITGFAKALQTNISTEIRIVSIAASSLFALFTLYHAKTAGIDYAPNDIIDSRAAKESKKARFSYGIGFICAPIFITVLQLIT
jgi:hypothetical protein